MIRFLIILIIFITRNVHSEEYEIPDDLKPIESTSEILYTYEFDDKPKIILRINENEFLVLITDDEDYITYVYNSKTNITEKKSEFVINDDEALQNVYLFEGKVYLYFVNTVYKSILSPAPDGKYFRETVINLDTYLPESSRIYYTTIFEEEFQIEDYGEDLEYATKEVDKKIFLDGLEEKEIESIDYRSYYITYNSNDSARKNIFHEIYERDEYKYYARVTNYYTYGGSPETNLVLLKDSTEDLSVLSIYYTYLDDKSNFYFLMSWVDLELNIRYISFNRITPDGKYTETIKEVPMEYDEEKYYLKAFNEINIHGNNLKLFGISRYSGEYGTNGLEPISGLYVVDLNIETMQFELKSKMLTEEEGETLNNNEDEFKFNRINRIYEVDGGYVVLAENCKKIVTRHSDGGRSYEYYFNDINLFSLDKDLNFRWNNFLDRDIISDDRIFGNSISSTSQFPTQIALKPTLVGDELIYIYSTTEPEEEIKRATYNIKTGDLVKETPLFENDGVPSYSPGYQFPIGNDEFVTLIFEDDYFIVKYKLLK